MNRNRLVGLLLATALVALTPLHAPAQEVRPTVRERIDVNTNTERREEPVRVQVGVNLFFPGPTGEGDEAVRLRDRVRRSIYEMAAGECAVVEQVLAKTCRLESINVNINISRHQVGQPEGYQANGNFALRITLK